MRIVTNKKNSGRSTRTASNARPARQVRPRGLAPAKVRNRSRKSSATTKKNQVIQPIPQEPKSTVPEPAPGSAAATASTDETVVPRSPDLPEELQGLPHETASAITLYMREAGQVPLLTPEQEVELAARIKQGDEAAREHMIRANLRLVVKIAREYEGLGLPLLDLINEGNIGLMKAVERFDPAKGGKLSTYSSWWIKQSIRRALANQGKTIRLPVHVADKIYHMRLAELRLQEALGREPTEEELAQELKTTPRKVAALRSAAVRPASLDAPLGDEDSSRLGEVVPDESSPNPAEILERRTTAAKVLELVNRLPEREATILRYRFGLHGGPEKTLEEVGRKFGVTRERVRQLQNLALNKLRRMLEEDLHALGLST